LATGLAPAKPSPFNANIIVRHRFRYSNGGTSISNLKINRGNLLATFAAGSTPTGCYRLISGVKLNRVELFTQAVPGTSSATVSLTWLGVNAPTTEISDTTLSSAYPAHIATSPPIDSSAAWWSTIGVNEAENLFSLTCSSYTIIDIWLELVLLDTGLGVAQVTTGATNLGVFYYCVLDGPNGTGYCVPVGTSSTLN